MSVILRTKDRPELLADALASLRAQTFGDFETILVNDGAPVSEALLAPAPGRVICPIPPPIVRVIVCMPIVSEEDA